MSKEKVERAHKLIKDTLNGALNQTEIHNVAAIRETLYCATTLLEESLGMTAPPPPRDALRPVDAPLPPEETMFAGEDTAGSSESAPKPKRRKRS